MCRTCLFSRYKETRLRSHGFDVSHGSTNTAQAFLLLLLKTTWRGVEYPPPHALCKKKKEVVFHPRVHVVYLSIYIDWFPSFMFLLLSFLWFHFIWDVYTMCGAECVSYRKTARALIGCHFLFLVGEIEKKGVLLLEIKNGRVFFF